MPLLVTPTPTCFVCFFGVFVTVQLKPGWELSEAALTSLMEMRLMVGPRANGLCLHRAPVAAHGRTVPLSKFISQKSRPSSVECPGLSFLLLPHSATPCQHSESPLTMGQKGGDLPLPLPLEQRLRSTGQGSRHWGNKRGVKKIKNQDAVQAAGTSTRVTERPDKGAKEPYLPPRLGRKGREECPGPSSLGESLSCV